MSLDAALRIAVDKTFNMVVVDGDTSTNDMVLLNLHLQVRNQTLHGLPG